MLGYPYLTSMAQPLVKDFFPLLNEGIPLPQVLDGD